MPKLPALIFCPAKRCAKTTTRLPTWGPHKIPVHWCFQFTQHFTLHRWQLQLSLPNFFSDFRSYVLPVHTFFFVCVCDISGRFYCTCLLAAQNIYPDRKLCRIPSKSYLKQHILDVHACLNQRRGWPGANKQCAYST